MYSYAHASNWSIPGTTALCTSCHHRGYNIGYTLHTTAVVVPIGGGIGTGTGCAGRRDEWKHHFNVKNTHVHMMYEFMRMFQRVLSRQVSRVIV